MDENFDPLGREEDLLGYEGLAQEQEDQPIIVAETEEERREEEGKEMFIKIELNDKICRGQWEL